MVNVVNPPRKSLGPSHKRQAQVEEEEYDELDSSQESFPQVKEIIERIVNKKKNRASSSVSSAARPSAPAPILPSPVASSSRIPIQPSPSPQPEQDLLALTVNDNDDALSPPPPAPTEALPLSGLKIVPSGKFSSSEFAQIQKLVLNLGGVWPEKIRIDSSASLVVMGRDITAGVAQKIIRKKLDSVTGVKGLEAWVEERRKEINQEQVSPQVSAEPDVEPKIEEEEEKPPAKAVAYKAKDGTPLSFWIADKIPASVRQDLTELLTSHGGTFEDRETADFRLVDPSTPFGQAALAEDSRNDPNITWRARPWHWVHATVDAGKFLKRKELESQNPVFVKPTVEGGSQLVCYLAKSLDREMPYLAKRIRSYGGVLTNEKKDARVLIVNEDTNDNSSTKTLKNNYGSDTRKYIVPYQWIQRSIDAGKPAVLVRSGPKVDFTPEEDELLLKFMAQVEVEQERGIIKEGTQSMKRKGEKMFRYMCGDQNFGRWRWARNHPPASWRERYRKRKEKMDPIIDRLCWELRKNGRYEDGFGEVEKEGGANQGTSNASASSSKPVNGKKRARSSSIDEERQPSPAAPPSPKRARTALAPRNRSASRVDEDAALEKAAVQEVQQEEDYAYSADDDNMAQDDTDYGLREDEETPAAAGDVLIGQEEPAAAVAGEEEVFEPIQEEEEDYDEEDRRALVESLRTTVEQVRESAKAGVEPEVPLPQEEDREGEDEEDDSDDDLAKAMDDDEAFAAALPETQRLSVPQEDDFDDDDDMYDVSGVSGGLPLAEDDQENQEGRGPLEPAQIVVDTVDSPPKPTARVTRSRSAVSAEPLQETTRKNGGSVVVARRLPSLGVEGAEAVPHLDIIPRKSPISIRRSSKSKSPLARPESPPKDVVQVVRSYSNTVSGVLSSLTSVASQAIDAISSPRTSFRTAVSRSPAPPQARIRNLPSVSPSPSMSRANASEDLVGTSSAQPDGRASKPPSPPIQAPPPPPTVNVVPPPPPRDPTPVLSAAEKKRKQEAAMAWSMAAAQRWNIPVLAAVQVLRQAGGNFELADEKLMEEQEMEYEWTKEEDEIVLRGTAQETKELQAKVGPMEFIARLTQLRS